MEVAGSSPTAIGSSFKYGSNAASFFVYFCTFLVTMTNIEQ